MPPKKAATTAAVVPKNITTAKLTAKEPATKRKAEEDIDEPTPKRGRNGKSQAATVTVTKKASKTTAKAKVTPKATPKAKPAARAATNGTKKAVGRPKKSTTATVPGAPKQSKRKATEDVQARPAKKVKTLPIINQAPTQKLDIYVFGEGDNGELGLGTAKNAKSVKRPRLNALLSAQTVGVVQVAAGGMHAAALTHDNKIYTWGVNDQGACGRDTTWEGGLRDMDADNDSDSDAGDDNGLNPKEATPTALPDDAFPEGTTIVQLAAGDNATFALTADGLVYGWGTFRGNEGILGFTKDIDVQKTPMCIPGLKKIKLIACGSNHVLALDETGGVFAWGSGQQNQLGRRIVERVRTAGLTPREFGLPKKQVKYISAGADHSFAIDKKDNVWAWGLNNYGQCGIFDNAGNDDAIVNTPKKIQSLAAHKMTCIKGGRHHSVGVSEKGDCLTWGRADAAQIGIAIGDILPEDIIHDERGRARILKNPIQVPNLNCTFATAESDHCIAITTTGQAYSWGFSGTYQTGQGTTDDVEVATLINNSALQGKTLNWAGAGGQYSILTGVAAEAAPETVVVNGGSAP